MDVPSAADLCNGGNGVALLFTEVSTSSLAPAEALVVRNGMPFLAVDRSCNYYTIQGIRRGDTATVSLSEVRTGVLDPDSLQAFVTDIRLGAWDELDPQVEETGGPVWDAVTFVLTDGEAELLCPAGCRTAEGAVVLPERAGVFSEAERWASQLHDKGTPVDGPAYVLVESWDEPYPFTPAEWPLTESPEDFVNVPTRMDGANARVLRELRTRQVSGEFGDWWTGGPALPMHDATTGNLYSVTLSDAMPIETPEGQLQILLDALTAP